MWEHVKSYFICKTQSTVMVCVQHVLLHHKFCCSSVNFILRVCAQKAYSCESSGLMKLFIKISPQQRLEETIQKDNKRRDLCCHHPLWLPENSQQSLWRLRLCAIQPAPGCRGTGRTVKNATLSPVWAAEAVLSLLFADSLGQTVESQQSAVGEASLFGLSELSSTCRSLLFGTAALWGILYTSSCLSG